MKLRWDERKKTNEHFFFFFYHVIYIAINITVDVILMSLIDRFLRFVVYERTARTIENVRTKYRRFISLSRRCSVFNPAVKLMISSCPSCDRLAQRTRRDLRRDDPTPDVELNRARQTRKVLRFDHRNVES